MESQQDQGQGHTLGVDGVPTSQLTGNLQFLQRVIAPPSKTFLIFTLRQACFLNENSGYFILFHSGIQAVVLFLLCSVQGSFWFQFKCPIPIHELQSRVSNYFPGIATQMPQR